MIELRTIRRGERIAVWNAKGDVRFVDGPRRLILFREWAEPLTRYRAEPHEYLSVRFKDGRTENVRGPASIWFNPVEHESITTEEATPVDAHQALVIYRRDADEHVTRRVLYGPALYVPEANEWLHEFCWHGADPVNPKRKIPRALQFTKLRVIPDQMYFDVRDVRTADDALLLVQVMVFFELTDIERMLDQTHDPIADFINALAADVIDFAVGRTFEEFKEATSRLNELALYENLVGRAERIGYRINKVVYRGYVASDTLQTMHDEAIEKRTALKLEAETERQAQELADLKLQREAERDNKRRALQHAQTEHAQSLLRLEHDAAREISELDHRQQLAHKREQQLAELEHIHGEYEERLRFLREIRGLEVDVTRFLVAQYQHPDRLIRVESENGSQLHMHQELN
jgi:hypothetical protein